MGTSAGMESKYSKWSEFLKFLFFLHRGWRGDRYRQLGERNDLKRDEGPQEGRFVQHLEKPIWVCRPLASHKMSKSLLDEILGGVQGNSLLF